MIEQLVSTVGQSAPAILGYLGQQQTNQQNRDIAREASESNIASSREQMRFQAQQTANQMKFEERMSNTAHQRAMDDLKKAGLNPLIGLNKGGASTPSGASASGSSAKAETAHMENPFAAGLTSALELKQMQQGIARQKEETALMRSQKNKTDMETNVMKKGIPEAEIKNEVYETIKPGIRKFKEMIQSNPKPYKNPTTQGEWDNGAPPIFQD